MVIRKRVEGGTQGICLFKFLPCLDEVPVGEMLLLVIRIRGAWPMHQVEVDIAGV
jgi:hypothetical protein